MGSKPSFKYQSFLFRPKLVGLGGGLVQTVNVYNNPQLATTSSAQPVWKLPKKPRKKRRKNGKAKDEASVPDESPSDVITEPAELIAEVNPETEVEVVEQVELEPEPNEGAVSEDHFKVQNSDFLNVQVRLDKETH